MSVLTKEVSGSLPNEFHCDRPMRILFVDDDDLYRETVEAELVERGFSVEGVPSGESLFARLGDGVQADAIILEWDLVKSRGIDLLLQLRERSVYLPVVFLTSRNSPICERIALERGAADFIDKARGASILASRLRLVANSNQHRSPQIGQFVRQGKLALQPSISRAYWDDVDVALTLTEYKIVHLLASQAGTYVTYRQIYDAMHHPGFLAGSGEDGYRTNVRSSIKRIRNKFRACSRDFREITTYHGFGYCWGTRKQNP
jgi:two-component system response regulator ChvI